MKNQAPQLRKLLCNSTMFLVRAGHFFDMFQGRKLSALAESLGPFGTID
jgi:hypothetical protein